MPNWRRTLMIWRKCCRTHRRGKQVCVVQKQKLCHDHVSVSAALHVCVFVCFSKVASGESSQSINLIKNTTAAGKCPPIRALLDNTSRDTNTSWQETQERQERWFLSHSFTQMFNQWCVLTFHHLAVSWRLCFCLLCDVRLRGGCEPRASQHFSICKPSHERTETWRVPSGSAGRSGSDSPESSRLDITAHSGGGARRTRP